MSFYHAVLANVSPSGRTQYHLRFFGSIVSNEIFGSEHEPILYLQKLGYELVAVDDGRMYFKKEVA
jgi:hypothetical protein